MSFIDLFIVYLAIGAPIGVFAAFRFNGSLKRELMGLISLNLLFWPIFVSQSIVINGSQKSLRSSIEDRPSRAVGTKQASGNNKTEKGRSDERINARRISDAVKRLDGLSSAISEGQLLDGIRVPELFNSLQHPDPALAAKCIYRRHMSKLLRHQKRAEIELSSLQALHDQTSLS